MELTGIITKVLEERSGVSKTTGNAWKAQQYVIETKETQPRQVMFEVFGEDKIKAMNIQVGEELTVFFDLDAREYQGRWFTQVKAWKVERTPVTDIQVPVGPGFDPFNAESTPPLNDLPFDANDKLPF